jgi:hypothetical protein
MAEGEVCVYGGLPAGVSLEAVRDALAAGFPGAEVSILDLGGELGPSLSFSAGGASFASLRIPEEETLLFDGVARGSLEEAVAFARRLSACLAAAGLEHALHVASGPSRYAASFVYPPEEGGPS